MELITSKENKRVKYIKKLSCSAAFRGEEGCFTAEGLRLCGDALSSGAQVVAAYFSQSFCKKYGDFVAAAAAAAEECCVLTDSIFSAVSDTKTPQGVLFVIKRLDKTFDFDKIIKNGKVLALENIQDPANLGTIIRTAEAFGIDAVVLSRGCCDVYAPKVIRGSMGGVFRIALSVVDDLPAFIGDFNRCGSSYAAVLDADSVLLSQCELSAPVLAALGNEGNGLTAATIAACSHKLYIPMHGKAESLNVAAAAGIIMWEMIK